ncbi:MAG: peptidyl-prolyl cis-trans isomerase [Xanthomonadales bacterium]|nr:peptidyl-prolyl cis-trans isomerase [Xanthomonadales bacterium]
MAPWIKPALLIGALALAVAGGWTAAKWHASWRPAPVMDQATLAVIGDVAITRIDFLDAMRRHGGLRPGQFRTVEQRRELLDALIEQELLISAARRLGLDEDPEVARLAGKILVDRYQAAVMKPRIEDVTVTDADVAGYYQKNLEQFTRPAQRRGAMIFVGVPENASAQLVREREAKIDQARAAVEQLDPGVFHFGELAKRFSEDRGSRYRGGVVGWVVQHPARSYRWGDKVVQALFSLDRIGDVSAPVRTDQGLYLVRLVDEQMAVQKPLEQVRAGIQHRLLRDRQRLQKQMLMAELAAGSQIRINEALLADIQPLSGDAADQERRPPALPTGES